MEIVWYSSVNHARWYSVMASGTNPEREISQTTNVDGLNDRNGRKRMEMNQVSISAKPEPLRLKI
jgi:hypothetical protein